MGTQAADPIIWHGNGVGKRNFYDNGHKVLLDCEVIVWLTVAQMHGCAVKGVCGSHEGSMGSPLS